MVKTYKIVTFGCQMNQSDSERIAATLKNLGYRKSKSDQTADLWVFNACSVRQAGIDRIYGQIENLRRLKTPNYKPKIVITGCLLPKDRQKFVRLFDLVFNIRDLPDLPRLLQNLEKSRARLSLAQSVTSTDLSYFKILPQRQSRFFGLVPISFGCSRFCTFCAVPYTRGLEIDRSGEEILAEVKKLIKDGFKEIWLLGQTASSWKDPKNPQYQFVDLLSDICKIPGRFWLRFTSPYLLDFDDELIAFLAKNEKVSRHWNLPLQSGSNKILAKMNRKYTVEKYWEILGKIKNKIPDFSFSTDIIVGFCGETKNDFQQTYDFFAKIKPTMAFIARYSPRPGTVSQKLFKDNVSPQIKKVRYQKLTKLLRQVARENLEKEVGRQLEVLVDSWLPLKKECLGKTRNYKTVRFKSQKSLVGQFVSVKIIGRREFELAGQLI